MGPFSGGCGRLRVVQWGGGHGWGRPSGDSRKGGPGGLPPGSGVLHWVVGEEAEGGGPGGLRSEGGLVRRGLGKGLWEFDPGEAAARAVGRTRGVSGTHRRRLGPRREGPGG